MINHKNILFHKQECIPVGCVLPTEVAIHGGYASVHAGIHPSGVGLETPRVLAWRPPQVWACRTPWSGPGDPLGVGLETPPGQTPQLPPGCGPGDPSAARHTGIPPPMHAWKPPPCEEND